MALVFPLGAVVVGGGGVAWGEPPSSLLVVETAVQSCPTAEAVALGVKRALPSVRVEAGTAMAEAPRATVRDLGPRFAVEVAGVERLFEDPARRCGERARAASVFIALTLDPPSLPASIPPPAPTEPVTLPPPPAAPPAPPAPPATPPMVIPPPAAPSTSAPWLTAASLDLGLAGEVGVRSGVLGTAGLGLRLALEHRSAAVMLGTRLEVPVKLRGGGLEASLWRIPVDIGGRASWRRGPLSLAGELGAGVELLRFGAPRAPPLNVRPLLRAGVRLGWRLTYAVEPFFAVAAEVAPWAVDYTVADVVVGHTPHLWLGASLGMALTFL